MSREAPRYDMTKGLVASRARTDEESGEEYSSSSRARGLSYSLYSLVCIGVTYSWCALWTAILTVVILEITDIVLHMYVFVKLTHVQKLSLLRVEDDLKLMLQMKYYFLADSGQKQRIWYSKDRHHPNRGLQRTL